MSFLASIADKLLPPDASLHGAAIDSMFTLIFWIALGVFLIVQVGLVYLAVRYSKRWSPRAAFSHGNRFAELSWTLIALLILAGLTVGSARAWDGYRRPPATDVPDGTPTATLLVIGQQYKWSTIYPGPDGKLGRYLVFPKPGDIRWPDGRKHAGVLGPAFLPPDRASRAIGNYIDANPLGKDMTDPDGKDDVWEPALAREIVLPAHRPIDIAITSKDVVHDFAMQDFRVKLDAVPGQVGHVYFEATQTSQQLGRKSEVVCEEFCGALHYTMRGVVRVVEPEEYDRLQLDRSAKIYGLPGDK